VEEGDRIMVGVSGGKDSHTLLDLLRILQRRSPVRFELLAVTLDQGHPGFPGNSWSSTSPGKALPYRLLREDTYSIVWRRRRREDDVHRLLAPAPGILYNAAVELGWQQIALGHHRDDAAETLLLNLFFAGTLRGMPPSSARTTGGTPSSGR
jgi:tRNA 2-thiocytidine biosynthesis protein TtcA